MPAHTFSIRVPEELLCRISNRALAAKRPRNVEILDLLEKGFLVSERVEDLMRKLVFQSVTKEELVKLETGQ